MTLRLGPIDRRMAIGGALVGATGLALPRRQSRTVTQRGIVGGGLVQLEQGEANFSLFVSRMIFAEDEMVVLGSVLWTDDTRELTLRSTAITEYIVPEVQPEQGVLRQIIGMMSVDGEGEFPFDMEIVDADLPGAGTDTIVLIVGDGARTSENATPASGVGFSYMATGTVVTGDIQELDLEIDLATGAVTAAED
jgi:microcompartment protein CcmK/EutM